MYSSLLSQSSPMVQVDFTDLGIDASVLSIKENAFLGYVNVRGEYANPHFMSAVKHVLKIPLPITANTFSETEDKTVLWLGPNEWLVVALAANCFELVSELQTKLTNVFSAVTDVSGAYTVLEVSGNSARALLLKGSPLDLHHRVFSVGQCAQSVMAKTNVILWQTHDKPVYKIIVRRSFADYLGLWLLDAAREYQA